MSETEVSSLEDVKAILKKVGTKRANVTYRTRILNAQKQDIGTYPGNTLPDIRLPPGRYGVICYGTKNDTGEVEEPEANMVLVVEGEPEGEASEASAVLDLPDWQTEQAYVLAERERARANADAEARVQTMRDYFDSMNRMNLAAQERADRAIAEANSQMQETLRAWGPPKVPEVVREEPAQPASFLERWFEANGEAVMAMLPQVLAGMAANAQTVNGGESHESQ